MPIVVKTRLLEGNCIDRNRTKEAEFSEDTASYQCKEYNTTSHQDIKWSHHLLAMYLLRPCGPAEAPNSDTMAEVM